MFHSVLFSLTTSDRRTRVELHFKRRGEGGRAIKEWAGCRGGNGLRTRPRRSQHPTTRSPCRARCGHLGAGQPDRGSIRGVLDLPTAGARNKSPHCCKSADCLHRGIQPDWPACGLNRSGSSSESPFFKAGSSVVPNRRTFNDGGRSSLLVRPPLRSASSAPTVAPCV